MMSNDKPDKPTDDQAPQASPADEPVEASPSDEAAQPDDAEASQMDPARRIEALEAERDQLFDRLQRVSADYQNYMRRAANNLNESIELARGDLLKSFVPVLDHFDNALSVEPASEEAKRLADGMRIVRDELLKVLQQAGVERIEVAVGEPFDPHRHEAMMRQPAEGVEPFHVSMFMQPGYAYGKRTLRPAKVAVAPEVE